MTDGNFQFKRGIYKNQFAKDITDFKYLAKYYNRNSGKKEMLDLESILMDEKTGFKLETIKNDDDSKQNYFKK
jgi:hypothetical protein